MKMGESLDHQRLTTGISVNLNEQREGVVSLPLAAANPYTCISQEYHKNFLLGCKHLSRSSCPGSQVFHLKGRKASHLGPLF